jgi:hypothetical protein
MLCTACRSRFPVGAKVIPPHSVPVTVLGRDLGFKLCPGTGMPGVSA